LAIELSPEQVFDNCRKAVARLRVETLATRRKRLEALRDWIHGNRTLLHDALHKDLRKNPVESDSTEIFYVLNEIKVALHSLERWAAPRKVDAPFYMLGSRSWVQHEPRGLCLVISPWNYPFNLAVGPLVSALAAGNAVILKPSELTPSVSAVIRKMCEETLESSVASVCEGGVEVSQALLNLPFDHIFFTGSPAVGKIVMKAAAEHLASVTLELGGKSPAIVAADANLDESAERIAVAKFINNGQTCIAPDYILADKTIARELTDKIIRKTKTLYDVERVDLEKSNDYGRIVSHAHFDRLEGLINDAINRGAKVEWDGPRDKANRFLHPVILTNPSPDSRVMHEEIFGPVLPIVTCESLEEAINIISAKPKPLALYVFTKNRAIRKRVLAETSSGTVCINDCGVQFLNHALPFGGVNNSGLGKSHGHYGFLAFSNEKPVMKQKSGMTSVRAFYPPYTRRTKQLMDWFLKLF
jgi:aldehyde dehydrogenase (NAD+)